MAIFLTLLDFLFFVKSVQPIQSDRHLNLPTFYSQQLQSRVFDLFFTTLLGVISFPLIMTSCLLILVIDRRTPFFKQQRVGFNGTLFVIYKLQTLNPVDLRPSILGAFLRTYNLDELPQLWNVLKGDMSLVGPRPEIPDKAKQFTAKQNQRHQVRPGITGYWQLSDHRQHPIADYAELDLLYVSTRNLWVDISILVATPFLMFQTSGPLKNVDLKKVS
jgi:lipopolysaccharide/colanic/teichoic acid biosynthesis glycosyltransferase